MDDGGYGEYMLSATAQPTPEEVSEPPPDASSEPPKDDDAQVLPKKKGRRGLLVPSDDKKEVEGDFGVHVMGSAKRRTFASTTATRVGAGMLPGEYEIRTDEGKIRHVREEDGGALDSDLTRDRQTLQDTEYGGLFRPNIPTLGLATEGKERLHGKSTIPYIDDGWKTETILDGVPRDDLSSNTFAGQKRKRYISQEKAWRIQSELSTLNADAFIKAQEYASLLDTLINTRDENPYVKYAVLVAMSLREPEQTYLSKPMTNEFIKTHKKQIEDSLSAIKRLTGVTQKLHREHVYDGINMTLYPEPNTTLDSFLKKSNGTSAGYRPNIYDKRVAAVPNGREDTLPLASGRNMNVPFSGVKEKEAEKKSVTINDGGSSSSSGKRPKAKSEADLLRELIPTDPDDITDWGTADKSGQYGQPLGLNVVPATDRYKSYDINTENEYAKEQIAALMGQVLENINVLRAVELTYTTNNRKSYEEVLTLGIRVKTEALVESALNHDGKKVQQRYPYETNPLDFTSTKEKISEICEYTMQNSLGRSILATAVSSKSNWDKMNLSHSSQSRMKRNDIFAIMQHNFMALVEFVSNSRPALKRTSAYSAPSSIDILASTQDETSKLLEKLLTGGTQY